METGFRETEVWVKSSHVLAMLTDMYITDIRDIKQPKDRLLFDYQGEIVNKVVQDIADNNTALTGVTEYLNDSIVNLQYFAANEEDSVKRDAFIFAWQKLVDLEIRINNLEI